MNEDELLLEFNYRSPNDWCKLGVKITGYNDDSVTGTIVDFDKFKNKTVVYIEWDRKDRNSSGGYRKYNREYLDKEVAKGTIKVKN